MNMWADLQNPPKPGLAWPQNSGSSNRLGINIGAGIETKLIDNVSLRATAKYTRVLNMQYFNNFMTYDVAFKFDF